VDTGLPVIYIDTNGKKIEDRENYVKMNFKLTNTGNPEYDFEITDFSARIRGRGNSTWGYPKKPYRLNFAQATSVFGLTANKNWVLLANYRDPTLIANTAAFKLGELFGFPWANHAFHVEVVLNGQYQGSYVLTEHTRVGAGRVDIDPNGSFLIEIDEYYDEEPKFRTPNLNLPVMISHPEGSTDANAPMFDFVREKLIQMDELLSDPNFPNNTWKDLLDIDSAVDYLMINEIAQNTDIDYPRSVWMYMEPGGKIKMRHLWDFDAGFGMQLIPGKDYSYIHPETATIRFLGGQYWGRFHDDAAFAESYKTRWNEKYSDILAIPAFIDVMYNRLKKSAELDNQRWPERANYDEEIAKLKTWYSTRVFFLNEEINK
jgi:spore coat protein CotH